jgi:hypothetical protein
MTAGKQAYDEMAKILPGLKVLFLSGYSANAIYMRSFFAPGVRSFRSRSVRVRWQGRYGRRWTGSELGGSCFSELRVPRKRTVLLKLLAQRIFLNLNRPMQGGLSFLEPTTAVTGSR